MNYEDMIKFRRLVRKLSIDLRPRIIHGSDGNGRINPALLSKVISSPYYEEIYYRYEYPPSWAIAFSGPVNSVFPRLLKTAGVVIIPPHAMKKTMADNKVLIQVPQEGDIDKAVLDQLENAFRRINLF
ncbi:MAG: hypothetical protein FWF01_04085 [Alphaproteobacteria bacterium]|nr:hypothetical protein [Alphaproteobacteria bacterium]